MKFEEPRIHFLTDVFAERFPESERLEQASEWLASCLQTRAVVCRKKHLAIIIKVCLNYCLYSPRKRPFLLA